MKALRKLDEDAFTFYFQFSFFSLTVSFHIHICFATIAGIN